MHKNNHRRKFLVLNSVAMYLEITSFIGYFDSFYGIVDETTNENGSKKTNENTNKKAD